MASNNLHVVEHKKAIAINFIFYQVSFDNYIAS